MKKLLLTLLVAVIATATYAQSEATMQAERVNIAQMHSAATMKTAAEAIVVGEENAATTQRKSKETGLYYHKPTGTFYAAWDEDGEGWYPAHIVYPALRACTSVNMSTNPTTCRWYFSESDYTDNYGDSNGNFTVSFYPAPDTGYYWGDVTLWNANHTESFNAPAYYSDNYPTRVTAYWNMQWLGYLEDKAGYGSGSLDNHNLMGTGTYTSQGVTKVSAAITQDYPAPAAPLYVEKMYIMGITISGTPLSNGATLAIDIYNADTDEYKGSFTATNDDFIWWYDSTRSGTDVTVGLLEFSNIVQAAFGDEYEPITIDYPMHLEITGFNNSNVDFGPFIYDTTEADEGDFPDKNYAAICVFEDGTGIYYADRSTGLPDAMNVVFYSVMDYVHVADALIFNDNSTQEGYAALQIGESLDDCHTYGKEGTSYDLGALYVTCLAPWVDDYGNETYYIDNLPSWITGIYYDDDDYDDYSVVYLGFTAEALPDGVEGRMSSFPLKGRGYTDTQWITVVQGNYEIPEGIDAVAASTTTEATTGTYNLAGQRVSESAKGLLIRDGKKVLVK